MDLRGMENWSVGASAGANALRFVMLKHSRLAPLLQTPYQLGHS
jgi:hypothetical protein